MVLGTALARYGNGRRQAYWVRIADVQDKIIAVESELQAKIACIDSDLERLAGKTSPCPIRQKTKDGRARIRGVEGRGC